jgi:hypothetical protein
MSSFLQHFRSAKTLPKSKKALRSTLVKVVSINKESKDAPSSFDEFDSTIENLV